MAFLRPPGDEQPSPAPELLACSTASSASKAGPIQTRRSVIPGPALRGQSELRASRAAVTRGDSGVRLPGFTSQLYRVLAVLSTFLSPFPALINEGDNGTTSSVAVRIAPRKDFRAELVNDGSVSRSEFRLGPAEC